MLIFYILYLLVLEQRLLTYLDLVEDHLFYISPCLTIILLGLGTYLINGGLGIIVPPFGILISQNGLIILYSLTTFAMFTFIVVLLDTTYNDGISYIKPIMSNFLWLLILLWLIIIMLLGPLVFEYLLLFGQYLMLILCLEFFPDLVTFFTFINNVDSYSLVENVIFR